MKKVFSALLTLFMLTVLVVSVGAAGEDAFSNGVCTFDGINASAYDRETDRYIYPICDNDLSNFFCTGSINTNTKYAYGGSGQSFKIRGVDGLTDGEGNPERTIGFWINTKADGFSPKGGAGKALTFKYYDTNEADGDLLVLCEDGAGGLPIYAYGTTIPHGKWVQITVELDDSHQWLEFINEADRTLRNVYIDDIAIVNAADYTFPQANDNGEKGILVQVIDENPSTENPTTAPSTFDVGILGYALITAASASAMIVLKKKR